MTNRDVIDKMTNEELGRFLDHIDCANCSYYSDNDDWAPDICTKDTTQCAEGIAKWLNQEPDFRMADYIKEEENAISEREREQYDALRRNVMDIYRKREEEGK